jgi:enoyl-CoA hydratase
MDDMLTMEFDGAVAILTLNRPAVLNALNADLLTLLEETLDAFTGDPALRAVILTGSGERAFAAGADIAELAALENAVAGAQKARTGQRVTQLLEALPVPTIAAVNGFALGGGCELALCCDFIYASRSAKFGLPEVGLGVIPGLGGTQRLPRRIGLARASELLFTGAVIDADEALRIGLVNVVLEPAELLPRVRAVAEAIAARAPLAVAAAKRAAREGAELPLALAIEREGQLFSGLFGSADQQEGMRAFIERRAAKWSGT